MFRKQVMALFALALSVLALTACGAGIARQYEPLREELETLFAQDVVACHYKTAAEEGDVYCAGGSWYCVTNGYTGVEYLAYENTLYTRATNAGSADAAVWTALPDNAPLSCEKRPGLYDLSWRLPAAKDFNRVEASDTQTVFFFSPSSLEAQQTAAIEAAEALVAQTAPDDIFRKSLQFNLELAKASFYTGSTLTFGQSADGTRSVSLVLTQEVPVWDTDKDGNFVLLEGTQTVTNTISLTVLDMDDSSIRGKIADAAALLNT